MNIFFGKPTYKYYTRVSRYHNDRMINYDTGRGVTVKNDRTGSTLVIGRAVSPSDGGNYTCSPYNVRPSSVVVHVVGADTDKGKGGEEGGGGAGGPADQAVHTGGKANDTPPSAAVQSNRAGERVSGERPLVMAVLVVVVAGRREK